MVHVHSRDCFWRGDVLVQQCQAAAGRQGQHLPGTCHALLRCTALHMCSGKAREVQLVGLA